MFIAITDCTLKRWVINTGMICSICEHEYDNSLISFQLVNGKQIDVMRIECIRVCSEANIPLIF